MLLAAMGVLGTGMGTLMPNLPKLVSIWFPPDQTGLATGIYNTGMMGGMSAGLLIAAYLPEWSISNLMLGSMLLILTAVFFGIVRNAPEGVEIPPTNMIEGFKAAAGSRSTWGAALALFLTLGGMVVFTNALPYGVNETYGISMNKGGQIASMINLSSIVGAMVLPYLAAKTDRRGLVLGFAPMIFALIMVGSWHIGTFMAMLGGAFIGGLIAGGIPSIVMEVPTFLPRIEDDPIEPQNVGGASGFLTTLMQVGGFAVYPMIVTPIIDSFGWTAGFWAAGIIFASTGLGALIIKFPPKLE